MCLPSRTRSASNPFRPLLSAGLVAAARQRATVFSTWGFGRKLSNGKGVTALFHGESGVGKTMTAEAVAFELGQNLYPVNLASMLQKTFVK